GVVPVGVGRLPPLQPSDCLVRAVPGRVSGGSGNGRAILAGVAEGTAATTSHPELRVHSRNYRGVRIATDAGCFGMANELTARPQGQRGWFSYQRIESGNFDRGWNFFVSDCGGVGSARQRSQPHVHADRGYSTGAAGPAGADYFFRGNYWIGI